MFIIWEGGLVLGGRDYANPRQQKLSDHVWVLSGVPLPGLIKKKCGKRAESQCPSSSSSSSSVAAFVVVVSQQSSSSSVIIIISSSSGIIIIIRGGGLKAKVETCWKHQLPRVLYPRWCDSFQGNVIVIACGLTVGCSNSSRVVPFPVISWFRIPINYRYNPHDL